MKSLEQKTGLIFDLFFSIIIMPLMIFLSPARYWWGISPGFSCITVAYLYGCYFIIKGAKIPELILSRSY